MDKCRKEFEKQRYWIGLFRTGVDFDVTLGEFGRYIANGSRRTDAMDLESFNEKWEAWANAWQHQQAKVGTLQKQNAWLIDVAERENKRANKLKEEHVSTTILLGKAEQQKAELQKRVDAALQLVNEMKGKRYPFSAYADQLEQALKGGGE